MHDYESQDSSTGYRYRNMYSSPGAVRLDDARNLNQRSQHEMAERGECVICGGSGIAFDYDDRGGGSIPCSCHECLRNYNS